MSDFAMNHYTKHSPAGGPEGRAGAGAPEGRQGHQVHQRHPSLHRQRR